MCISSSFIMPATQNNFRLFSFRRKLVNNRNNKSNSCRIKSILLQVTKFILLHATQFKSIILHVTQSESI
jgi:hypothetical protein